MNDDADLPTDERLQLIAALLLIGVGVILVLRAWFESRLALRETRVRNERIVGLLNGVNTRHRGTSLEDGDEVE